MKKVSLSGSSRKNVGKKDAAQIRRDGQVPAVLYGGESQTSFSMNYIDIEKLIFTPNVYEIELDIDGTKTSAIIQDVQIHPVTDKVIHVDFLELIDGKPVKISLPVILNGLARGVRNGGRQLQIFRKLRVIGEKNALPEAIEINIEKLRIGQDVRVKDISIPGVKLLDPANAVIVAVKAARGAVDDEEEDEEAAEGAEGSTEGAAEGAEAPKAEEAAAE